MSSNENNTLFFSFPASTTYLIPGIVKEVSAIFVETTINLYEILAKFKF